MKSPEYVAIVVSTYRRALDAIAAGDWKTSPEAERDLLMAFNRGFTNGYLFGDRAAVPFRYLWVLFVFIGTVITHVDGLWLLGDVTNSAMVFPNVIAILALSGVVVAMAREADRKGNP